MYSTYKRLVLYRNLTFFISHSKVVWRFPAIISLQEYNTRWFYCFHRTFSPFSPLFIHSWLVQLSVSLSPHLCVGRRWCLNAPTPFICHPRPCTPFPTRTPLTSVQNVENYTNQGKNSGGDRQVSLLLLHAHILVRDRYFFHPFFFLKICSAFQVKKRWVFY